MDSARAGTSSTDAVRVDRWLWAVRLYKTRTAASEACGGGHVRVNGSPAKPATRIRPGDRVSARMHGRDRSVEVVRAVGKRLGAAEAAACLVDHSPPMPAREDEVLARSRGSGRPTKRDRRQLDRMRR